MAAQTAQWTLWLVVLVAQCAPAASLKEGPAFATFAFEHPPDVLRGSTSESLYVEDSSATTLTDKAASSNLITKARVAPSGTHRQAPPSPSPYPPGWGPTGPIHGFWDGPDGKPMPSMTNPGGAAPGAPMPGMPDMSGIPGMVGGDIPNMTGIPMGDLGGMTGQTGIMSTATGSPTPSPTFPPGWPTPHPTFPVTGGGVSATGDPHLQNVHGERFDLMKLGKHVLINIPRGDPAESALLRVEAEARRLGGQCADTYFQQLNITGAWVKARQTSGLSMVEAEQTGGIFIHARGVHDEHPDWMKFGKVYLKVVHGRTKSGLSYLNFYVKHLGQSGFAVGGLLGEDDHTEEATPSEACVERLSLIQSGDGNAENAIVSVAEASFD